MKNFLGGARLSWRRILLLLTAIAAAAGVAIGLTVWASFDAAAATIPPGTMVATVTPVFGSDPNIGRHHLDHAFTITDPAQVARIAGTINGLAPFPVNVLSCSEGNGAAMKMTFKASLSGPTLSTVLATYTGCPRVWNPAAQNMPYLVDQASSGQQVQQLVLSIAGVRWPYTPDVLPPFHRP
jgi:hypothetical protein